MRPSGASDADLVVRALEEYKQKHVSSSAAIVVSAAIVDEEGDQNCNPSYRGRYSKSRRERGSGIAATNPYDDLYPNGSRDVGDRDEFSRFGGKVKGVIVDEEGLDVLYRRKLESGDAKESFKRQAVRLLGPPARFEASKLKVAFTGEETDTYSRVVPRTYTLSHCDFTANLTLTISNIINLDQLKGWYNKDDVVAEWTQVNGNMCLDVHCYVSGPNLLQELAAEFRYLIFSKELPLVLEAVLYGDSVLFKENPELTNALVRVFFHSSSKKYNHVECWGPLKDAVKGRPGDHINGLSSAARQDSRPQHNIWGSAKSIFQALATFLL
nr:protein STAY-GREEN LIKE, chloroplastic [Ipomoea batatas]